MGTMKEKIRDLEARLWVKDSELEAVWSSHARQSQELEQVKRSRDGWEADAKLYCNNAEHANRKLDGVLRDKKACEATIAAQAEMLKKAQQQLVDVTHRQMEPLYIVDAKFHDPAVAAELGQTKAKLGRAENARDSWRTSYLDAAHRANALYARRRQLERKLRTATDELGNIGNFDLKPYWHWRFDDIIEIVKSRATKALEKVENIK